MTARIKFVNKQNVVFQEIDVPLECESFIIFNNGCMKAMIRNRYRYYSGDFLSIYYIENLILLPNLRSLEVGIHCDGSHEKSSEETLKPISEWPNVYELFQNLTNVTFPYYVMRDIGFIDEMFPMHTWSSACLFLLPRVKRCIIHQLCKNLADLCLSMNTLDLPDYVLLWIADFTPYMNTLILEFEKIDLIRRFRAKEGKREIKTI